MRITPINFIGIKNNIASNIKKPLFYNLSSDTVTFTSNHKTQNNHVDDAVDLGYEIHFNLIRKPGFNAQKFVARKEKDVQILPISELGKERDDASNYCAYFSCEYDDDIKPMDMKLYVGEKPQKTSSVTKLLQAMEIAHEYTHLRQTKDYTDAEFLKELSNGNKEYLLLLNGLGGGVFSIFDNDIQAKFVSQSMDITDAISISRYGQIAPAERNIDKERLLRINGLKNQEDFNKIFNELFDTIYDKIFLQLDYNSSKVEPRVKDAYLSFLANDGSLLQLREDVRKYCAFLAQTETEAYTTESKLAKRVMKTDSTLNIDAFPIYYNLLFNAFSH